MTNNKLNTEGRYTIGVIQKATTTTPPEIIAVCRTDKAAADVARALENQEPLSELVKTCRKMLEGQALSTPYRNLLKQMLKPFEGQFEGPGVKRV